MSNAHLSTYALKGCAVQFPLHRPGGCFLALDIPFAFSRSSTDATRQPHQHTRADKTLFVYDAIPFTCHFYSPHDCTSYTSTLTYSFMPNSMNVDILVG